MRSASSPQRASSLVVRAVREFPVLRRGLVLTVLLALAGTVAQLVVPIFVQRVTDSGALVGIDTTAVLVQGAISVVLVVAGAAMSRTARVRLIVAATTGLDELRVETFGRLHRQSVLHTQEERRGALVARVTSDITAVQDFLEWGGVGLLVGSARVLFTLAVMFAYSWRLALLVTVATGVYVVLLLAFQRILARAHDAARGRVADVMAATGEAISGLPVVRAYGAERHALGKLDRALGDEFRAGFRASVLGNVLFATAEIYAGAITAMVVAAGIWLGAAGDVTSGVMLAFVFLVALLVDPVQTMVEIIDQAQSAAAGLRRVFGVHDAPVEVADPGEAGRSLPDGQLDVRVEGLDYRYPDGTHAIRGVQATVAAGERVAVVGETGSGKTTFAKLLVRIIEPDTGVVEIGGVPVDLVPFASLRSRVTYVPQEGFLHDGTVEDAVRYGRLDATRREITEAFGELGLDEWLDSLPDGLDTRVGERGSRLSAGERQLVAITRAWIADPDLLVLDEATSSVDPALEVGIRQALDRLLAGRTSLTVAHRLSTAEASDRVFVFDAGRLVEAGTPAELVDAGGIYTELHRDWVRGTSTSG